MNKKLFSELVESMTQMNEIVPGKRAPYRKFDVDANAVKALRAKIGPEPTEVRGVVEYRRRDTAQLGARATRAHRSGKSTADCYQ
jgi:hypothetical protein